MILKADLSGLSSTFCLYRLENITSNKLDWNSYVSLFIPAC